MTATLDPTTSIELTAGRLRTMDPAEVTASPGDPDHNPHTRRHLRHLTTLLPGNVTDTDAPDVIAEAIGNPRLPAAVVADTLAARDHEPSVRQLRATAALLNGNSSPRSVATRLGLPHRTVRHVRTFLAVPEYRAGDPEALRRIARHRMTLLRTLDTDDTGYPDCCPPEAGACTTCRP